MEWREATSDQIEQALDHFAGLSSAGLARVCELIAEVDSRQSWMADGARSLTDWVAARLRIRHASASRLVTISLQLTDLPHVRSRFSAGDLSLDQVDAITRMASPETEEAIVEEAMSLSSAALDLKVRRRRSVSEEEAMSVWERRKLIRQWNLDESELRFHGRLPGSEARLFDQAIDSRVDEMDPNPETGMFDPLPTRAADALIDMAAAGPMSGSNPSHVSIFTDLEALTSPDQGHAELDNTAAIPNSAAQRLACDAILESVLKDGDQVVGIGRRSRTVPGWLRRLVYQRDASRCQHPGCRNTRWLQIHHIVPWAHGGRTDLDNLILLCGFHHRFVHEHGWHITGPPERRVFRRPDWTLFPHPRRPLDPRLRELVST